MKLIKKNFLLDEVIKKSTITKKTITTGANQRKYLSLLFWSSFDTSVTAFVELNESQKAFQALAKSLFYVATANDFVVSEDAFEFDDLLAYLIDNKIEMHIRAKKVDKNGYVSYSVAPFDIRSKNTFKRSISK